MKTLILTLIMMISAQSLWAQQMVYGEYLDQNVNYPAEMKPQHLLTTEAVELFPGEQLVIGARALINGPKKRTWPVLAALRIACNVHDGSWTFENWQGDETHPQGKVVYVRTALTVDRPTQVYCWLEALSATSKDPDTVAMTVIGGANTTYLVGYKVDIQTSNSWGENSFEVETGAIDTLLEKTLVLESERKHKFAADLQVTTCPYGSVSKQWCTKQGTKDQENSEVFTRTIVDHYNQNGEKCESKTSAWLKRNISNNAHHHKIFNNHVFNVPKCASQTVVSMQVYVRSGNPIKVEGMTKSGTHLTQAYVTSGE